MQTFSKSELRRMLDEKHDALVINVLPRSSFDRHHIPGSINIPVKENPDFAQEVETRAGSKNKRIVVYCANTQCNASKQAAQKLENDGFTNVQVYEEGVEGWFGDKQAAA